MNPKLAILIAGAAGILAGYRIGYTEAEYIAAVTRSMDQIRETFKPHQCYWRELCNIHNVKGR